MSPGPAPDGEPPGRPRQHEGEQAVQRRAGEGGPDWGSPMFTPDIPIGFMPFLSQQQLVAISGVRRTGGKHDGAQDEVWCSVLAGEPGLVEPVDRRTLIVHALPAPGDPVRDAYDEPGEFAMVVMSPQTLRRVKLSGTAQRRGDDLVVRTEQVLGNCPKYLQHRVVVGPVDGAQRAAGEPAWSEALSSRQQQTIAQADSFFIASLSPRHGADANHRGGMPGFVTVEDARTLSWPDYVGNSFYMTLGNLELYPRCGVAFPLWETGGLIQLTGTARIDWDPVRAAARPGALRTVEFSVERVVQIERATRLRWELLGYSHFNPPPSHADPRSANGQPEHRGATHA